jgi:hypothetical protein
VTPRRVELADVLYGVILGAVLGFIAYQLSGLDAATGVVAGLVTAFFVVLQSSPRR